MDLGIRDQTAVVTGGSRGIGKAVARVLAAEGAHVALIGRDLAAAQASADEIARDSGRTVRAYAADTGNDAAVKQAFERIAADFGRIDMLVNAAAQPGGQKPPPKFAEITQADLDADMHVKVMGYLRCSQAAVPHMLRQGGGRIVHISGLAARSTGAAIGSIRNVAVAALAKNMADELGPQGIVVTCVHPGLTRTEKTAGVIAKQAAAAGISEDEMAQRMGRRNALQRWIDASDVANVVAFLASPLGAPLHGESIGAGGGTPGVIHY
jgi:NAD(P)-dependent dehydrogenase (short-subunit alcohol dehydrogenase family)